MFSLGVFPAPPQLNTIPQNPIVKPLIFPNKTNQTHLFHSGNVAFFGQIRTGFCASASKIQRKGVLEIEDFDDDDGGDYEEFEDYDDEGEDVDVDEDEELIVPLENMKKWLQNRPRGFGEGREYDTSIEDKLFEEMEQSRLAQLANLNKLKNNPEDANSKKQLLQKQKVLEDVPSGLRVRLVNLPKKKNIHRDLQLAFKGVPGIVKIVPAVSGNKKTREPICKGIAFVDFKSQDEANRFVQRFSKESIAFGKVQKQIKCEVVNSSSLGSASEQSVNKTVRGPQLAVLSSEKNPVVESYMATRSVDSREEAVSDEQEGADDDVVMATWEDTKESLETLISSEPSVGEQRKESATNSVPSKQQKKIHANGKTLVSKTREKTPKLKFSESAKGEQAKEPASNSPSSKKQEKILANGKLVVAKKKGKLNIPGSANRLKSKEKNVLTDVFSKYGAQKAPVGVKEQS